MKRPNDITTKIADIMNDEICKICRELNVSSFKEPVVANCRWMLASDIKVGCYKDIPEEVFFHIDCNNTWCGNYIIDRLIGKLAENDINLYLVYPECYTVKSEEAIKKSNYTVFSGCEELVRALCDHTDKNESIMITDLIRKQGYHTDENGSVLIRHDDDYFCPICGERGTINHAPMNCKVCGKFGSCRKSFELGNKEYNVFRKGWKAARYIKGSGYTDKKYAEVIYKYCNGDSESVTRQNSIIIALNKKTKRR